MRRHHELTLALVLCLSACGGWGSGTKWAQEPLSDDSTPPSTELAGEPPRRSPATPPRVASRTLGQPPEQPGASRGGGGSGHSLGVFRNTYYDFPREGDYGGKPTSIMSASCQPIATVPRAFFDAVCVQGSGSLERGGTVSFSKRNCSCAEACPRTGERICFDALDPAAFPWGRGAAGKPISPMKTVAADTDVLPMGTILYLPELDGAPRDDAGEPHDGCFVVEDRGLQVKGEHVDIFTGRTAQTRRLNERVPSNRGVTVVVAAPRGSHL